MSDLTTELKLLAHHIGTPALAAKAARNLFNKMSALADEHRNEQERERGIHPSQLAYCLRAAAMELNEMPRFRAQQPEALKQAGMTGSARHAMHQSNFVRAAQVDGSFAFTPEVKICRSDPDASRLALAGSSDGVFKIGSVRMGLEIKTLSGRDFKSLKDTPRERDMLQASVYQHCLELDGMWFMYESRETFQVRHIPLKISEKYWEEMERRAEAVMGAELLDMMPIGLPSAMSCRMCSYEPICPQPRNEPVPKEKVYLCLKTQNDQKQRAGSS